MMSCHVVLLWSSSLRLNLTKVVSCRFRPSFIRDDVWCWLLLLLPPRGRFVLVPNIDNNNNNNIDHSGTVPSNSNSKWRTSSNTRLCRRRTATNTSTRSTQEGLERARRLASRTHKQDIQQLRRVGWMMCSKCGDSKSSGRRFLAAVAGGVTSVCVGAAGGRDSTVL